MPICGVKHMKESEPDAYIEEVLRRLNSLPNEYSGTAITTTLLICNMALDHTVASPELLQKLSAMQRSILTFIRGES